MLLLLLLLLIHIIGIVAVVVLYCILLYLSIADMNFNLMDTNEKVFLLKSG